MNQNYVSRRAGRPPVDRGAAIKGSAFLHPPLNVFMIPRPPLPFIPLPNRPFQKVPVIGSMQRAALEFKQAKVAPILISPKVPVDPIEIIKENRREWKKQLNDTTWPNDPFKTLFVGRLSYTTDESMLEKEFSLYGQIQSIKIIRNKQGTSRGYGFVEYAKERDLKAAYHDADGRKVDGRRIIVDVERARTTKGWLPRRLGGGLGSTRKGSKEENQKLSGRDTKAIQQLAAMQAILV